MSGNIEHKTLAIKAGVNWVYGGTEENQLINWLYDLADALHMEVMGGPYLTYLDIPGFKGWTGTVHIKTSHFAIHIWEDKNPIRIDLDVYTCGKMNETVIKNALEVFGLNEYRSILFDREHELEVLNVTNNDQ